LIYLVRNNKGFYPSMIAYDQDIGSSVARFLSIKERAAAKKQGLDICAQMEEAWLRDSKEHDFDPNDPTP
jgi:hypothetical protein